MNEAPFVPYRSFYSRFKSGPDGFKQGDHVTILGPTESGKSTLALDVLECRDYVAGMFTKPEDPIYKELEKKGWRVSSKFDPRFQDGEIVASDRKIAFRVPNPKGESIRDKVAMQGPKVAAAMDYVFDSGSWCIYVDEGTWVSQHLDLRKELEAFWYQGRTMGISLVFLAQRPAWIPKAAYSQARHIFLFFTGDEDDQKAFSDISGKLDTKAIRAITPTLGQYEFLYMQPLKGIMMRSKVEKK